jgi:hypothetical protein
MPRTLDSIRIIKKKKKNFSFVLILPVRNAERCISIIPVGSNQPTRREVVGSHS